MTSTGLNHRYMPRNFVLPFNPMNISGLIAWYDASDADTITGSPVSQWNDKSASGFNLTQATPASQPATGTRTQNGLNVLDFDGIGNRMSNVSVAQAQPFTVFMVAQNDVGADGTGQLAFDRADTAAATTLGKTASNVFAITGAFNLGATAADTSPHVFMGLFNAASSEIDVDAAVTSGAVGTNAIVGGILVGCRRSLDLFWNGWIGEVLLYNTALSATNRSIVRDYLRGKWGL